MNPFVNALEQYESKNARFLSITTTSLSAFGILVWVNYRMVFHWAGSNGGGVEEGAAVSANFRLSLSGGDI